MGRAAWPPQLLIAVWLYGYSRGVTSARELERQMEYEPGLMWLTGMEVINHHTLSDFRIEHGEALTDLFAQMLVVLSDAGLVKMRLVAHDGTKIRAQAGVDSFRREATLREKLEAGAQVGGGRPASRRWREPAAAGGATAGAAGTDGAGRVGAGGTQVKYRRISKDAGQQDRARVSSSEAEARQMKHGDNAMAPSYNTQVSTDADSGVIVGVHLSQSADDSHGLKPAMEEIHKNLGRKPEQVVADGGFTNRESIQRMAESGIDFYGSLPDPKERSEAAMKSHGIDPKFAPHFFILQPETRTVECPAGKQMKYLRRHQKRGDSYESYRAKGDDCIACAFEKKCCPNNAAKGRIVSFRGQELDMIAEFRKKMASEQGQRIYKRRGATAEFPFAWIKERMKLRKFRLFGLRKAGMEALWASLAYNVMLWIRARDSSCKRESPLLSASREPFVCPAINRFLIATRCWRLSPRATRAFAITRPARIASRRWERCRLSARRPSGGTGRSSSMAAGSMDWRRRRPILTRAIADRRYGCSPEFWPGRDFRAGFTGTNRFRGVRCSGS